MQIKEKTTDLIWEFFLNGTGLVSEFPPTYTTVLKELGRPAQPYPQPRVWALDPR